MQWIDFAAPAGRIAHKSRMDEKGLLWETWVVPTKSLQKPCDEWLPHIEYSNDGFSDNVSFQRDNSHLRPRAC